MLRGLGLGFLCVLVGCGRIGFEPKAESASESWTPSVVSVVGSAGSVYFVSPDGSDARDGTTRETAFATFAHALTVAAPDATVVLAPGTYTEPLIVTQVAEPNAPLAIVAETAGSVVIDGEGQRQPCLIDGAAHVIVAGIDCVRHGAIESGGRAALEVRHSHGITVQSMVAFDAPDAQLVRVSDSWDIVVEDVAAVGAGEKMFYLLRSRDVVLRRTYAEFLESADDGALYDLYGSDRCRLENVVGVVPPGTPSSVVGVHIDDAPEAPTGGNDNHLVGSVLVGTTSYVYETLGDTRMTGNRVEHTLVVSTGRGMFLRAGVDNIIENVSVIDVATSGVHVDPSSAPKTSDFSLGVSLVWPLFFRAGDPPVTVTSDPRIGRVDIDGQRIVLDDDVHPFAQASRIADYLDSRDRAGAQVRRLPDGEPLFPMPIDERIVEYMGHSTSEFLW